MIETILLKCSHHHFAVICLFDAERVTKKIVEQAMCGAIEMKMFDPTCHKCGKVPEKAFHFPTPAKNWSEVPMGEKPPDLGLSKCACIVITREANGTSRFHSLTLHSLGDITKQASN